MQFSKLLSTLTLCFFSLSVFSQSTFYVTSTGAGSQNGDSWANASSDLKTMLTNAEAAAIANGQSTNVWVAQGTYRPSSCSTCTDSDRLEAFRVGQMVQLIGGFSGTETTRLQASPSTNLTILSGDIGTVGTATDNSYNVVWCEDCKDQAGIEGFTIQDGYANRAAASGPEERGKSGAGIYLTGQVGRRANLNVTNCVIQSNYAEGFGAGMYCNGGFASGESSPVIKETLIQNNISERDGGGFYAYGAFGGICNPKIFDSEISNNSSITTTGSCSGAGIYIQAAGGTSNLDFVRSKLIGNATIAGANTSANGGGLYVQANSNGSSTLKIENSLIRNNSSFSGGGAYLLGAVQATFTNCTIIENSADGVSGSGGGIYNNATGGNGGQLTTITNSIIYNNSVSMNAGSASDVFRLIDAQLVIDHSIVDEADCTALNSNPGNGDVSVVTCNTGMLFNVDPMYTTSSTNPTLANTSPAINAGNNATAVSAGGDLLGATRIQQGIVDIGALESASAPLPVELLSFEAKALDSKIRLEWKAASEVDLDGYKLLRRNSNGGFNEIVFVPAMESGSYFYEDAAVVSGKNYYYQLVSVDLDGTTYDSDLVTARLKAVDTEAIVKNLYPNPTNGLLNIVLNAREGARTVYATVLNQNGQRMLFKAFPQDGEHQLNLSGLPSGNYIVRLSEGERTQTEAIVIQH